ncbi:DNA internalization-related competence protein ComEC/Rec2, partial [Pluralibacter sp.]|uniref:DNA internalization-related competence protein ComEC/Rec2 n=1 Tax=Pluralibacter sp. TaxID=1920032 RepID=UPI0025EC3DB7
AILSATPLDASCSWRARYLASLQQTLAPFSWRLVIIALGMGERLSLPPEVKAIMQQTGTMHLMAISGLHIALGALLGSLLVRGVQRLLPGRWINWRLPLAAGFLGAFLYAVLTGLQPPALRTVVGIGVWYALRLHGRRWSSWEAWLCGMAAILAMDPLAVLSQSLWLSCFAVAALIFWYQWVPPPRWKRGGWLLNLLHLQVGLMFLLLPLQVLLFHGVSGVSVAANLFAVPLVTLLIVPLILTGMLLHLTGLASVEYGVWQVTDSLMAGLFWLLYHLPTGWLNIDARGLWPTLLPWLLIVVWRFHAWTTAPALWGTLCILLTFPFWRFSASHLWRVTMLDVGQGLAMVIERNGRAILYDTGLAWPGGDSAQQLIVPWLRWHHLVPDGIIISHEHLDHRGGLNTLAQTWPTAWIRSSLGWKGHQPCQRGERWYWEGLRFQALWPLPGGMEKGNNHSCVVRVDDGHFSILLTGDIELAAEKMLISHYWQHVASTVIQVPHHGSLTSSGVTLLQRVNGTLALASAARYNAWHFPAQKVKKRYQQQGYRWLDTPHQGQITLSFNTESWQIHSLRDQYFRRWYHQWFGDTPENG